MMYIYHIQQNKTNHHQSVSHGHKTKQQQEDRQTTGSQSYSLLLSIYIFEYASKLCIYNNRWNGCMVSEDGHFAL